MYDLIIENLSVRYKNNIVLEDISFKVKKGEFLSVVGRSGCGKSTLLHSIAGLIPYTGKIIKNSKIGIVFQDHSLFPWMRVKDNILSVLRNDKDKDKKVDEYLELTGLKDKCNAYPDNLSGGQKQRVALARALAFDSGILLMDEPYGALDVYTKENMQTWLMQVWMKNRKTVLFVTHDIEEAVFLSDRIMVLDNKRIQDVLDIDFTRPRQEEIKFDKRFIDLKRKIHSLIHRR